MSSSGNRQVLSANGSTTANNFIGPVRVSFSGTFGSGTIVLEAEDPSGAQLTVIGSSSTADADLFFDFPAASSNELRATLTGATAPTLAVWIQGRALGQNIT